MVILNLNDSWGNESIIIIKIKALLLLKRQATTEALCLAGSCKARSGLL